MIRFVLLAALAVILPAVAHAQSSGGGSEGVVWCVGQTRSGGDAMWFSSGIALTGPGDVPAMQRDWETHLQTVAGPNAAVGGTCVWLESAYGQNMMELAYSDEIAPLPLRRMAYTPGSGGGCPANVEDAMYFFGAPVHEYRLPRPGSNAEQVERFYRPFNRMRLSQPVKYAWVAFSREDKPLVVNFRLEPFATETSQMPSLVVTRFQSAYPSAGDCRRGCSASLEGSADGQLVQAILKVVPRIEGAQGQAFWEDDVAFGRRSAGLPIALQCIYAPALRLPSIAH